MIKKEFNFDRPSSEPCIERPIPELGIVMIRLEGTKEEIDAEVSRLGLQYPGKISTFEDAQFVTRIKKDWGEDSVQWGMPDTLYDEIYYLWLVREL